MSVASWPSSRSEIACRSSCSPTTTGSPAAPPDAAHASAHGAERRQRRGRRTGPSIVPVDGDHVAAGGVDLDVVDADIDGEHQATLRVLEVDFVQGAGAGRRGSGDGLLLSDRGLWQQALPSSSRDTSWPWRVAATRGIARASATPPT